MENTIYNRAEALKELAGYISLEVQETIEGNQDQDFLADDLKDYADYIARIINNPDIEQWEFFEQPMTASNIDIKPVEK